MKTTIPTYIKPFLWSYDTNRLDLKKNQKRIITNVLNLGSQKATDWIFKQYSKQDIKKTIARPLPGEWNDKSLNYWSLVLGVKFKKTKRNVL